MRALQIAHDLIHIASPMSDDSFPGTSFASHIPLDSSEWRCDSVRLSQDCQVIVHIEECEYGLWDLLGSVEQG